MSIPSETLWEDAEHVLRREDGDLVLGPASLQPTPVAIAQLERGFALRDQLDAAWALRPRELVRRDGRPNLVFDDPGGNILARHVGEPWQIEAVLRVGVGLATALRELHAHDVIHRDIKPAHILVDLSTGTVRLTGFGHATRGAAESSGELVGTLAYMSPEQTGRLNRPVDKRSDLYAVGVTLYELLAGHLPFTATTPIEWIHSHVARPVPALPGRVPTQLAAIVLKLLAKTADDRYQTAAGLAHDLQRCLADLRALGRIDVRALGAHDEAHRLLIAERLYGRTDASKQLAAAFARASTGTTELVLVSGYSGIGKTALVAELVRSIGTDNIRIGRGKFDQYKRDIPYATLAEALQALVGEILRESDASVARWRSALREALGTNGGLITTLVPELQVLVGEQPPVPEVAVEESKHRFQLLLQRVLSVFARPEQPLVLFLDDLQWVDRATLDLLRYLLGMGARHILVIGAYRDNEVLAAHPLLATLDDIRRAGAKVHSIVLGPLPSSEVATFIADTLQETPTRVAPLAQLVHAKTGGNPFFVIQFILALRDDGLLTFDDAAGAWTWDLSRILARGFTDNLAEFMVAKIGRLSVATRDVLEQFACLGRSAPAHLLAALTGREEAELETLLWDAMHAGLVVLANGTYAFPHDRVQEASYALTTAPERVTTHLRIARILSALDPARRDEQMFEIANHFNLAVAALTTLAERREVAALNLAASRRAATAIAFESARKYAVAGLDLLGLDGWTADPELAFALTYQRASCEYLSGELLAAAGRLAELATRSGSLPERCQVACLRAAVHLTLNQPDEAIAICLDQLRAFGIAWTPQPSDEVVRGEYETLLAHIPPGGPEQFVHLPMMSDATWRACMDVLLALEPAAVFSDKQLHDLAVMRMANLSIEHGNSEASPLGFSELAMVLWSRFNARTLGLRFGALGRRLVEECGLLRFAGRVFTVVGHHVMPWNEPIGAALALMRRANAISTETGDLVFRLYTIVHIPALSLAAGAPLDDIHRELELSLAAARKSGFELIVMCLVGLLRLVESLRGVSPGTVVDETPYLNPTGGLHVAACFYWIRQAQARVHEGDFAGAVRAVDRAEPLMWTTPSFFERAEFVFYGALARAGTGDRAGAAAFHAQLVEWAAVGPETFTGRAALVGAELARLDQRDLDAELGYEAALDAARAQGFVHEEALAHEIAARFYDARGLRTSAQAFRTNARACYERWGAYGKVRQLDRGHRGLSTTAAGSGTARQLDVATVLEISHAVSSEIVHERLVERLMAIAVEHAGAARGLLITPSRDGQVIEAEALAAERDVAVSVVRTPVDPERLPASMLHYVMRTQQIVNLDDATKPNTFSTDPYLVRTRARSVLCFPFVRHGELAAVLYLENSLTSHAFTADRLAVLRVLASQAAISLENARLYDDMKRTEIYLAAGQALSHTGSFGWNVDTGKVFWSKEAYAIYGYEPSVVATPLHVIQRIHPEDQPRVVAQVEEVMRESADWVSEFRIVMDDGAIKDVHVTATAVRNAAGEREYIGAVLDVTDRRRAEQAGALALANDRLERALRGSNVGIWDFTTNDASIAGAPMYSVNLWESLGYRDDAADSGIHPERWYAYDRGAFERAAAAVLRGDARELDIESRVLDHNGAVRWRLHRGVAERDSAGRPIRLIGTSIDITDRKVLEDQLRSAKDGAEAASRAKDDFLANVSHEIRTPMNAVLGMTELVLDTEVTPEQRQWLGSVKSAADSLLVIIDDLLDFSKIEAGKLELHVANLAVRSELDDTLRPLRLRAEGKGLALRHHVEDAVPDDLVGDVGRLRQIVINLVGNAVKFTAEGEVVVDVQVVAPGDEAVELAFCVRDTGIGIPADKQAMIFQAFTQQDTSTTRLYGGTGLGLTIAARLASLMGGRITVASEPGRGSTFTFTARFARRSRAPLVATPPLSRPVELAPAASPLRVLVAEDNEFNAQLLRELLTRRGHAATVASDGREAVARFEEGGFDLLMLDLHMPVLDGFEVIARIRALERERGGRIPVIALTARSRDEDRVRCRTAGMDEFLAKPIHAQALWATIDRLVAGASPTLVDAEALLAASASDPQIFERLRASLVAALPGELRAVERSLAEGDARALRECAHRLHGMVGAASSIAGAAASELEDLAAAGALEAARPVLARLGQMIPRLVDELSATTLEQLEGAKPKPR